MIYLNGEATRKAFIDANIHKLLVGSSYKVKYRSTYSTRWSIQTHTSVRSMKRDLDLLFTERCEYEIHPDYLDMLGLGEDRTNLSNNNVEE